MPTLAQVRHNPWATGKSDEELIFEIAGRTGRPPEVVAYDFGLDGSRFVQDDPGLTTAFQNSLYGLAGSLGQVGQDVTGGRVGKDLERWGDMGQYRNPVTIMEGDSDSALSNLGSNLVDQPFNTVGQIVGSAAGYMLPSGGLKLGLAGLRALRGAEAVAGASRLAEVGKTAADGVLYGLPSYGGIRDTQEEVGYNSAGDMLLAAGGALTSGMIEGRFGPEAILSHGKIAPFIQGAGKNFFRTGLKTGAVEAGEELMQNPIEQLASYQNPLDADNIDQTLAGGLAGFVGGKTFGMAAHPFMRKPLDTKNPYDLLGGDGSPSQGDMFNGESWTPINFPQMEEADPYNPNNRRQMDFLGELDRTLTPEYRQVYPVGMGGSVFQDMPITDDAYRQPRPDLATAPRIETPVPQDLGSAVALLQSIGNAPVIEGTSLHDAVVAAREILDANGVQFNPTKQTAAPAGEFSSKKQNELWARAQAEVQDDGYLAGINQAIMERKYGRAEKLIKQAKEEQNAQQLQGQPQAQVRQEPQGIQAPRENGVVQGAQDGRGAAAPSQGGQVVVPVSPGTDSGALPAAPVPPPSPQVLSLARLIPAAGLSSQETQLALVLNDVVNQGGNPAELTNEQIAQRMGLKTQNQVTPIRRRVQKKLAKAAERAGVDLQAALAPKMVAPADESMLGMSPAVQPSVINEEEVFGSIDGDVSPSSGVIASAGGSQANWQDTGSAGDRFIRENNDESVPEFIPAETAKVEEDIQRRVEAEAKQREDELLVVLEDTDLVEEAGADWDYLKSPGAPEWSMISRPDRAEWTVAWSQLKADEEALVEYQREMEQNVEVENGQRVVENRAQSRQGGPAQGQPRLDAPRRKDGSSTGETIAETQGSEPSFSRETDEQITRKASLNQRLLDWANAVLKRRARDSVVAIFPVPPSVLKLVGVYRPVTMNVEHAGHILQTHPEIKPEDIAALPDLLKRPRAILEHKNGLRFIVDARDESGRPLVVALTNSVERDGPKALKVTEVSTLFGANESARVVVGAALDGRLKWLPEKEIARIQALLPEASIASKGAETPTGTLDDGRKVNVLSDAALVKFEQDPKSDWSKETVALILPADAIEQVQEVHFSRTENDSQADTGTIKETTSDEEAKQNIAYLDRGIKRHLGEEASPERAYAPARLPSGELLGRLASAWGARIQGFRTVGNRAKYGFFGGVYFDGNRDVIYLNVDSRRPHVALLGHELVHYLRRNNPELFAQFKEQVFQYVKDGEYQAWSKLFAEKGDKLKEEFLGEVVSDGFMNRTFWEAVGRNNPSLLKRVVAIVNKLVNEALAAIGYTPKTKSVVSDFNRVMEIAGEVMAKAGLEMGAVEQAKDTPSFSRAGEDEFVLPARYTDVAGRLTLLDSSVGFRANDLTRAADKRERAEWKKAKKEAEQNGPYVYPEERARLNKWAPYLGKRVRFLDMEPVMMGEMDTPTEVVGTLFIRQVVSPDNASPSPRYKGSYEAVVRAADGRESSTPLNDETLTPMGIARGGDTPSFSRNITDEVIAAAPAPAQKAMHTVVDTLEDFSGRTLNYSMFTNDLVEKVSDMLTSAKAWYEGIRNRETLRIAHEAKVDDIANLVDQLPAAKFNRTWGLIKDMTKAGKWGYAPTWRKDVTVDPAMQERYNALDKDEQSVIDAVFKMGDETIRETQAALDALADEIYGEKLATVKDDRTRAKLEKEKGKFKRVFRKDLSVLEGPYAPMRRVGSYVTAAKSARYADLEKQAANGDAKAADELLQLRADGKHYQVVFSDSLAQARAVERELHAAGFPRHLTSASAKEVFTGEDQLPFQAFEQIRQMALAKGEKGKDVSKLMNLIDELYLTSLADTSARKSELRRTGVEGLNPDTMYKAFLSKGKADAHYLSILKTHQQVSRDFTSMREESKSIANRADKMDAFNELKLRYENSFNFDPSPLIGRLMNISAMWYLMTKPAYYLYNLTQPLMMAQPYIAQEHGYGAASGAMTKAYNDLLRSQKMLNLTHLDVTKLPEDIRQAMVELRDAGRIDITITQDLGSRLHGGNNKVSKALSKVERALRTATQKTEMVNRIVTAAAAYRLELAKTKDHAAAVEYAKKVVDRTQGDYSNFNAPRLLNATNFRKLITQFRKFQFIQASLLIRMVNDSLRSATPHERAMARRALMFTLGHHAVLAGALGLPLANVVAMAFSMTGGEDEPRDLELWMRRELGDNAMADLLMHGVPAVFNVNVSSNVGMGQTFSVVPFADFSLNRDGFEGVVTSALGPVFGLGRKGWEAMGKAQQGDYYGFLAGVLPGAASSSLKAVNEFASGVENKRGDVLVNPEEISFMDSVVKALGFKTQDDTIRQLVRGQQYEFEQFFKEHTTEIKKAYTEAYRDGDHEEMMALRERWQEMQEFRREYGFKPQPLSALLKAPAEQRKREAQTIGGVQYNSGNKGFVSENAAP